MATPESQGGIDYPDGGFASGGVVYPISGDLGELAARLKSSVTFNREGNVLYVEDFGHGANAWSVGGYGTGGDAKISNSHYRSAPYSLKLTAGSDGAQVAYATINFAYPALSRYGFEFSVAIIADCDYAWFVLRHYDGTYIRDYQIKYDDVNSKLQIKDDTLGWVDIATGVDLTLSGGTFDTWKLVFDLSENTYTRLILNAEEYDLSAYTPPLTADTSRAHLTPLFYIYSTAGNVCDMYLDDIIITQNEPLRGEGG